VVATVQDVAQYTTEQANVVQLSLAD